MPVFTGEPWRGLTKMELRGAANARDVWTVSVADVDPDTASGDQSSANWDFASTLDDHVTARSITLRLEYVRINGDTGLAPAWGTWDTFTVSLLTHNGLAISGTWTNLDTGLPASGNSATRTFRFDTNPLDTGSTPARFGIAEIRLAVSRGATVAWGPYNSDGTISGGTATGATFSWARGFVRGRPKLRGYSQSSTAGNPTATPPTLWAYPDSIYSRVIMDSQPWSSGGLPMLVEQINAAGTIIRTSGATLTGTQVDMSFSASTGSGRRIDASSSNTPNGVGYGTARALFGTNVGWVANTNFGGTNTDVYSWADTGHIAGWERRSVSQIRLASYYEVEAGLTFTQHLQEGTNVYSTPPLNDRIISNQMLSTSLGFIGARVQNARGEGQNAGTLTYSFRDIGNLTTALTASGTPSTGGGEAGWGPLLAWSSSKPGGSWRNVVTFSDSAGVQQTVNHNYVMLTTDPRVGTIVGGGSAGEQGDHFTPGDTLIVGASWIDRSSRVGLVVDTDSPVCSIARLNVALGRREHLTADGTWQPVGATAPLATHVMRQSPGDSRVYVFVVARAAGPGVDLVSDTTTWGTYDLIVQATCTIGGSPYGAASQTTVTSAKNRHSKYKFDIVGKM